MYVDRDSTQQATQQSNLSPSSEEEQPEQEEKEDECTLSMQQRCFDMCM